MKLALLFLFFPILICAQQNDLEVIVDDYCTKIANLEWEGKSFGDISTELTQTAQEISQDHEESIAQIKMDYKSENPEATEREVEVQYIILYTITLVENCQDYLEVTKNLFPACPDENETLKRAVRQIDNFLKENDSLSYSEQMLAVEDELVNFMYDHEEFIQNDYERGLEDPAFVDELSVYLIHKSNRYYRAFLVREAMLMYL